MPSTSDDSDPATQMDWEVLIVGRSYAGLSAALTLGRARRTTLVVGEGGPRNDAVTHTHGLSTRDGASPAELVAAAESELAPYETVQLVSDRVLGIEAVPGGFRARIGPRTVTASAVMLATGVNDDPLPIPGVADHWGRGVYTCPFCDGWEHRDQRLGVLAPPAFAPHLSRLLAAMWTDQVVLFTGTGDDAGAVPTDEQQHTFEALAAEGITVEHATVTRVLGDGERVYGVEVDGGRVVDVDAVFGAGVPLPNNSLAKDLGCELDADGFVVVGDDQSTSVPGVWALGDLGHRRQFQMSLAIASGVTAATGYVRHRLTAVQD